MQRSEQPMNQGQTTVVPDQTVTRSDEDVQMDDVQFDDRTLLRS